MSNCIFCSFISQHGWVTTCLMSMSRHLHPCWSGDSQGHNETFRHHCVPPSCRWVLSAVWRLLSSRQGPRDCCHQSNFRGMECILIYTVLIMLTDKLTPPGTGWQTLLTRQYVIINDSSNLHVSSCYPDLNPFLPRLSRLFCLSARHLCRTSARLNISWERAGAAYCRNNWPFQSHFLSSIPPSYIFDCVRSESE